MKRSYRFMLIIFLLSVAVTASTTTPSATLISSSTFLLAAFSVAAVVAVVSFICVIYLKSKMNALDNRFGELEDDFNNRLQKVHESMPDEALTGTDVLLLLKEELDRRGVGKTNDHINPNVVNSVGTDDNFKFEVFYFGRPTAELMFDDNRKTLEHFETSLYRFTVDNHEPDQATIDFVPSRHGAVKALDERKRTVEPVCNIIVKDDKPTAFRQVSAGRAILKNGFWTVVKKMEIIYE